MDVEAIVDESVVDYEGMLPSTGYSMGDGPVESAAGLPMTLVVDGLESQLASASKGYSPRDFVGPVMDAVAVLRQRHAGDAATVATLDDSLRSILRRVVESLERELSVDFASLGLEPGSATYAGDVYELYRFFVVDRRENVLNLLLHVISADSKSIVERYKRTVEKKNQTISEARRVFAMFDDVVVWWCIPQVLADYTSAEEWYGTLEESLRVLGVEGDLFLVRAGGSWPDELFLAKYLKPFLADPGTEDSLRDRWYADAPKKTGPAAGENEEEE